MKLKKTTLFFTALFAFSTATLSPVAWADNASPFKQGVEAAEKGDYQTAYNLWKPLAEQGYADAQYNLGLMYYNGHGVKQDYHQAVKWFTLAAEQGDAEAQYNLGMIYGGGLGIKQDSHQAVKWFTKAAEQEHAKAQGMLATMYGLGKGVRQDMQKAKEWMGKSCENGSQDACETLHKLNEGK